jgi:crotonobetainyl-CoA:carnitine CoA-transferase CaiB-like acyl-CoA transferase
MGGPLSGLLVVSLEQAVAAPYCSSRLADAGAGVIKIERAEGDFARGYDTAAKGLSSYFVWLNRGKQSLVADIKRAEDAALVHPSWRAPTFSFRTSRPVPPLVPASGRTRCANGIRG